MKLTYNIKNKILLLGVFIIVGFTVFLLAQLVFADSTASLLPSSDGVYLQWTPKTEAIHYVMVDEVTCNGTTDYNFTNTVGNRDSYGVNLATIPNGSTITAIEITPCASRNRNRSGSARMNVFYRYNGTNSADAGSYALTGTVPTQLIATTFSGLSFVKSASSTLEIGAVLSAGTKGARLGRIAAIVTYTSTTSTPPTVNTNDATNITASSTTLNGSTNPNGLATTGWFRYSITDPGSCNDTFGTRTPATGGTNLGSGTSPVTYSKLVTGLSSGATYYYCAIASNSGGKGLGNMVTFSTSPPPNPPVAPSNLTATTSSSNAILNWTDNANDENGFKIERSSTATTTFSQIATVSSNVTWYSDSNLSPDTYTYRVRAFNDGGYSGYSDTASVIIP